MKNIYITENQLKMLSENKKEITFYEFFVNVKRFLKDLITKPETAKPNQILLHKIDKSELLNKMLDLGIIKKSEKIEEVLVDESSKKVAKHYIQYKIPKRNFEEKVKELYKDVIDEQFVFANEQEIVDAIKEMDYDGAYSQRGGLNEEGEGGGGATSCGSVMQGGGGNPDAGQYTVPFGDVQRRSFYKTSLKRNKDSKNGSVSINHKNDKA